MPSDYRWWFCCILTVLCWPSPATCCKHCTWAGGCNGPQKSAFCYTIYSAMTGEAIRYGCADEVEMSLLVSMLPPLPKWCTVGVNQTAVCACRVDAFATPSLKASSPDFKNNNEIEEGGQYGMKKKIKGAETDDGRNSITPPPASVENSVNQQAHQKQTQTITTTQDPSYGDSWYYKIVGGTSSQPNMNFNQSDLYPATRGAAVVPVVSTVEPAFPDDRRINHFLNAHIDENAKTSMAMTINICGSLLDTIIRTFVCSCIHILFSRR